MAVNEIRNISFSSETPVENRYPIVSGQDAAIVVGELAGIMITGSTQGQVRKYDPAVAGLKFLGVFNADVFTDLDGTSKYVAVDHQGLQCKRSTVASSTTSKPGDLVYATGSDPLDELTMTSATIGLDPVAVLHEQTGGSGTTEWDVIFLRGAYQQNLQRITPGKVTTYTGDGPITLPTENYEAARLTGAGSTTVQTTLAVPTVDMLGFVLTVYRDSAGSGAHDVDFTNEAGTTPVTHTFADGNSISLLATSTTGWRRIG
jgi:hypothetical protein